MVKVERLREQITQNAKEIKNKCMLETLTTVSGLLRKKSDGEDYRLLTDAEWERLSILSKILEIEDTGRLRRLNMIADCFVK